MTSFQHPNIPDREYQRGWNAGWTAAIRSAHGLCTCRESCGDTPEADGGVCKRLRRAPEPPLVEIVTIYRSRTPEQED